MHKPINTLSSGSKRFLAALPTGIFVTMLGLGILTLLLTKSGVSSSPSWEPWVSLLIGAAGGVLVWRGVYSYERAHSIYAAPSVRATGIELGAGLGLVVIGVFLVVGTVLP